MSNSVESTEKSANVIWHNATVTRKRREEQNGHKGTILWFTGLSGSGKSSLAHAIEEQLHQQGCRTFVLDGDNVRHGLSSDLIASKISAASPRWPNCFLRPVWSS